MTSNTLHLLVRGKPSAFDLSPSRDICAVSSPGCITFFHLNGMGSPRHVIHYEQPQQIKQLKYQRLPNQQFLAVLRGGGVSLFDPMKSLKPLSGFANCKDWITDMEWSPHTSNLLATCSDKGDILIWDARTTHFSPSQRFCLGNYVIKNVEWNPSNPSMLSASTNKQIVLFDIRAATTSSCNSNSPTPFGGPEKQSCWGFIDANEEIMHYAWSQQSPSSQPSLMIATKSNNLEWWDVNDLTGQRNSISKSPLIHKSHEPYLMLPTPKCLGAIIAYESINTGETSLDMQGYGKYNLRDVFQSPAPADNAMSTDTGGPLQSLRETVSPHAHIASLRNKSILSMHWGTPGRLLPPSHSGLELLIFTESADLYAVKIASESLNKVCGGMYDSNGAKESSGPGGSSRCSNGSSNVMLTTDSGQGNNNVSFTNTNTCNNNTITPKYPLERLKPSIDPLPKPSSKKFGRRFPSSSPLAKTHDSSELTVLSPQVDTAVDSHRKILLSASTGDFFWNSLEGPVLVLEDSIQQGTLEGVSIGRIDQYARQLTLEVRKSTTATSGLERGLRQSESFNKMFLSSQHRQMHAQGVPTSSTEASLARYNSVNKLGITSSDSFYLQKASRTNSESSMDAYVTLIIYFPPARKDSNANLPSFTIIASAGCELNDGPECRIKNITDEMNIIARSAMQQYSDHSPQSPLSISPGKTHMRRNTHQSKMNSLHVSDPSKDSSERQQWNSFLVDVARCLRNRVMQLLGPSSTGTSSNRGMHASMASLSSTSTSNSSLQTALTTALGITQTLSPGLSDSLGSNEHKDADKDKDENLDFIVNPELLLSNPNSGGINDMDMTIDMESDHKDFLSNFIIEPLAYKVPSPVTFGARFSGNGMLAIFGGSASLSLKEITTSTSHLSTAERNNHNLQTSSLSIKTEEHDLPPHSHPTGTATASASATCDATSSPLAYADICTVASNCKSYPKTYADFRVTVRIWAEQQQQKMSMLLARPRDCNSSENSASDEVSNTSDDVSSCSDASDKVRSGLDPPLEVDLDVSSRDSSPKEHIEEPVPGTGLGSGESGYLAKLFERDKNEFVFGDDEFASPVSCSSSSSSSSSSDNDDDSDSYSNRRISTVVSKGIGIDKGGMKTQQQQFQFVRNSSDETDSMLNILDAHMTATNYTQICFAQVVEVLEQNLAHNYSLGSLVSDHGDIGSGALVTLIKNRVDACRYNARQAVRFGASKHIEQVWSLIAVSLEVLSLPANTGCLISWRESSLGCSLMYRMVKHLLDTRDIVTLATVVCVLGGSSEVVQLIEPYITINIDKNQSSQSTSSTCQSLSDDLDSYLLAYADILTKWTAVIQAAEVRKYISSSRRKPSSECLLDVNVRCSRCGAPAEESRGIGKGLGKGAALVCGRCEGLALVCFLCQVPMRCAGCYCVRCGHGGHREHVLQWFEMASTEECATGCGCKCLLGEGLDLGTPAAGKGRGKGASHGDDESVSSESNSELGLGNEGLGMGLGLRGSGNVDSVGLVSTSISSVLNADMIREYGQVQEYYYGEDSGSDKCNDIALAHGPSHAAAGAASNAYSDSMLLAYSDTSSDDDDDYSDGDIYDI